MVQQTGQDTIYPKNSPFNLDNDTAYQTWRERKLKNYPHDLAALVVEVNDPRHLSPAEHEAILARCKIANMAIYASEVKDEDTAIPREFGRQFGLTNLDSNMCADDDGITSLTVTNEGKHQTYIPYSNRPIHWHTDGYYNSLDKQIHALLLFCVRNASDGGENALLDCEIAYILMRDENPAYIQALMQPNAMCIPANVVDGEEIRPTRCGPVFSLDFNGNLHTRYTMRTRSINWQADATAAVNFLENLLNSDSAYILRGTLQAGQGLISNNVLHDRTGFTDSADPNQQRLLYRARYFQRIADC